MKMKVIWLRSVVLILTISASVAWASSVRQVDCSQWAGGSKNKCLSVSCSRGFLGFLGIWDGKYEKFDEESGLNRPYESRVIFSKNSCFKIKDAEQELLVGKQFDYYPRYMNLNVKNENALAIIIKQTEASASDKMKMRFVTSKSGIMDYDFSSYDSKAKKRTWKRVEGDTTYTFSEITDAQDLTKRNVQMIAEKKSDPHIQTILNGSKKFLIIGDRSYFAGKTWTFKSDGTLISEDNVIIKRDYDPIQGLVLEKEFVTEKKGQKSFVNEVVYSVNNEIFGLDESTHRLTALTIHNGVIESVEVQKKEDKYSEQKYYSNNGELVQSKVRSISSIDEPTYIKEVHKNIAEKIKIPESVNP